LSVPLWWPWRVVTMVGGAIGQREIDGKGARRKNNSSEVDGVSLSKVS
jgi:hypothetical protein